MLYAGPGMGSWEKMQASSSNSTSKGALWLQKLDGQRQKFCSQKDDCPHAPLGVQITGLPGGQADASALLLLCQGALPHPTGWSFYPLDHWPPKLTPPRPSLIVPTAHTGLIHSLSSEHLRAPSFPAIPQQEQRNFQNPHSGDIR